MDNERIQHYEKNIKRFLILHRWWVMALMGILAIMNEVYDHLRSNPLNVFSPEFLSEVAVYGLVLPILGGLLFNLLARAETDRVIAVNTLDQHEVISKELSQASSWMELTLSIARFPSRLLPVESSALYVLNRDQRCFKYASGWSRFEKNSLEFPSSFPLEQCINCQYKHPGTEDLIPCICDIGRRMGKSPYTYCLPLVHANNVLGMLYFLMPESNTIPLKQFEAFTRFAPEIALVLDRAILHRSVLSQSAANEADRRRIARDLHDSLAQNIGYLRFKLDELSGDDVMWEISAIRLELERMREIADQAYGQVRDTLTALHPGGPIDLTASLREFSQTIEKRVGFHLEFSIEGIPAQFPIGIQRQILFIGQEALINIEKHAGAKNVHILVSWTDQFLTLRIVDDGCGFDPSSVQMDGHYGMSNMYERAKDIYARLNIDSVAYHGTSVVLKVPLDFHIASNLTPFLKSNSAQDLTVKS